MKVTKLGTVQPILNSGPGFNAGGRVPPGGNDLQVLTSNGSNGRYWGENVRRITANGSNILASPDVNFAAGSNVIFSIASNTLTIAATSGGGGGSALTVEDEGSPLSTAADTLNFVGAGVTASGAGTTKTITIPGGSGGVDWTLDIDEDGSSFANWTAGSGTWSSNGTEIIQTDTAGAFRHARHNTKPILGLPFIVEVDMWFHAAGQGGGGLNYAALQAAFDGANVGSQAILLDRANGLLRFQAFGATDVRTIATTINADTWYTIRMYVNGQHVTAYKDGVLMGTTDITGSLANRDYVGLGSYASTVKFRNFKMWTLSTGLP